MLRPGSLSHAHMETHSLRGSVAVLTDLLMFEKVWETPGSAALKHPATDWLLVVHEGGPDTAAKQMHNHYGVRVIENREVNAAYAYLMAHQEEYGLEDVGEPAYSHGSFSLYFREPGTNGWEIECFQDVLRKESGGTRLGGVRSPHWQTPSPPERFPGRGYVPQAFTHGTLAVADETASAGFYTNVLGLESFQAYAHVIYVKHPMGKHYIVCLARPFENAHSPDFRYTLTLESTDAVEESHLWLKRSGSELGVKEVGPVWANGRACSFLLRDPDNNWWEIASPD